MLEKAAKASWDAQERRLGSNTPWESADEIWGKEMHRIFVRAVLEAIRSTDGAVRHALDVSSIRYRGDGKEIWRVGIDAILAEKE